MKTQKVFPSRTGFTVVEVLVALGLLMLGLVTFLGGFVTLSNITKTTAVSSTFDKQINEICSNIKAGIENYQVNFNYKTSNDQDDLPVEKLPMAWDIGVVAPRAECQWCQGAYGYSIRPLETMRGLYSVQIRFTHKSWGTVPRDVSFVVSVK